MEAGSDHTGERVVLSSLDKGVGRAGAGVAGNLGGRCVLLSLVRSEEPPPRGPFTLFWPGRFWHILVSSHQRVRSPLSCPSFQLQLLTLCSSGAGAKKVFNAAHAVLLGAF